MATAALLVYSATIECIFFIFSFHKSLWKQLDCIEVFIRGNISIYFLRRGHLFFSYRITTATRKLSSLCSSSLYRTMNTMGTGTGTGYLPSYMTGSPTELATSPQLWNNQGTYHRRGDNWPDNAYVGLSGYVSDVIRQMTVRADVCSSLMQHSWW